MAEPKSARSASASRPMSPHLQIYRPTINMIMSIVHRLTGVALYVGTLLGAWILAAAATGPEYFEYVRSILGSTLGQVVLFGYTWALFHHLLGGVRHFIWDTGAGYDLGTIDRLSWGTLVLSVLMTLAVWGYVMMQHGGAV